MIILKIIEIKSNDANQRIDKFLSKSYKNLPQSMIYKSIRKKDIKLNGKRCSPDERLKVGDILTLYLKDEFFEEVYSKYDFLKAPNKLDIVYEDENLLLVNKKPGLIVHPDEDYHFDSLIARIQRYLFEKGEYDPKSTQSFAPALVNRIDRNTSGIVIAAKNAESLRILNQKLKDREIKKFYLCIALGIFKEKSAILRAYLAKNEAKNKVYIYDKPMSDTKLIETKYKVLKEKNGLSLLEVELLTGRTHQIRAHLAYVGHPLLGDGKYGKNSVNKAFGCKWQALHSYKLKFDFKTPAEILAYLNKKTFCAPTVWFANDF